MAQDAHNVLEQVAEERSPQDYPQAPEKSKWDHLWPVIACGAGLFSDGYLNGVIGSVSTMLATIYPKEYAESTAQSNVSSVTFASTLLGNLLFGWTSDHWSRKWSLFVSTVIIIVFAALSTGSYGAGGSIQGSGEYPAGSVSCAESTGELKSGTRHRWFILFTNVQIDAGFVVAALVPMIVARIAGDDHLRVAWYVRFESLRKDADDFHRRICMGLGVIPPLSLLYLRLKLHEPEAFTTASMVKAKTPWVLCIKFYWFRLTIVSLIWLLYNFSSYAFNIFSSQILANLLGENSSLWVSFGWNTLLTSFYMPGCIAGSWLSDWSGPKKALGYSVLVQEIIGFIMAGCYSYLYRPSLVAAFVVVYGIFIALGELGPGDNIGLIASKTCATSVRGKYYGIAEPSRGTLVMLYNQYANSDPVKAGQYPFFIASTLCIVTAGLALFLLPHIGQDTIEKEDERFRAYLIENNCDVGQLGIKRGQMLETELAAVESAKLAL
ncbi:hypothetical protein PRZ48_009128 [Zasmidium cellare]|uniref:MFS general substrate transporter n=1 Tax=Zasmidium cellare TaxID=395010 RepID=A0ABR0EI71_ZASCE|nr:hypothetical protein PRZ48_009128 [Zasmidium cellare]